MGFESMGFENPNNHNQWRSEWMIFRRYRQQVLSH
jgi:hypothetical protein